MTEWLFYAAGGVAVVATALVVTRRQAVHALLYLILSLLAVAVVLFLMGAPFVAALEVIVYAGAVMVLFVFALMVLGSSGGEGATGIASSIRPREWVMPALLAAILGGVLILALGAPAAATAGARVGPREVGRALFGPYVIGVELASLLLLAGLVGAAHLGRRWRRGGEADGEES